MVLKCKMCGGDIQISSELTHGTCDSCGTATTLPNLKNENSEQKANAYNRANHFRMQNDFDKALSIYEKLIAEDDTDAEAHWCAVLCRFGIEYVTDPTSGKRVPTCHRASYDLILNDVDYLATINNTKDEQTKSLYQQVATYIAEVQKNILAISQNESPYDVFICYKETDSSGSRTVDSTLAQDIYYQLNQIGYKVFFAKITLEDKLGQAYEPYIFSALNSAKVMLCIGTKADHFNAAWVKNEWSRYLALMKNDHSRLLIPCYRDMDAYDIPDQLAMLQSQDMSKIGFLQDLIRGIGKVIPKEEAKPVVHSKPERKVVEEEDWELPGEEYAVAKKKSKLPFLVGTLLVFFVGIFPFVSAPEEVESDESPASSSTSAVEGAVKEVVTTSKTEFYIEDLVDKTYFFHDVDRALQLEFKKIRDDYYVTFVDGWGNLAGFYDKDVLIPVECISEKEYKIVYDVITDFDFNSGSEIYDKQSSTIELRITPDGRVYATIDILTASPDWRCSILDGEDYFSQSSKEFYRYTESSEVELISMDEWAGGCYIYYDIEESYGYSTYFAGNINPITVQTFFAEIFRSWTSTIGTELNLSPWDGSPIYLVSCQYNFYASIPEIDYTFYWADDPNFTLNTANIAFDYAGNSRLTIGNTVYY